MSRKNKKGRSSIITIFLVIIVIALAALVTIKFLNSQQEKENNDQEYFSHLDEEDFMIYEYDKIDSSLNGLYAFAIRNDYVVGVCSNNNFVNIYNIDSQKQYDYSYLNGKLYLLDKELGEISVISLKDLGKIIDIIDLNEYVESFQVVDNNTIYYIANNMLKKIENSNITELYDNITCDKFVVKNSEVFIVKDKKLLRIKDKEEVVIANDVENIEYFKYYERDRLLYDTSADGLNVFKNIYNYYNGQSTSSIKNNTYFIPYDEFKYIYITNDRKNIVRINDSGSNEYIYKVEDDNLIEDITFYKEGYIEFRVGDEILNLELDTKTISVSDNITCLNNIKFIK